MEQRSLLPLRRTTATPVLALMIYIEVDIFRAVKTVDPELVAQVTKELAFLLTVGKDDLCRAVTAVLARVWEGSDFECFDARGIAEMQAAALRSLIKPNKETQSDNASFFSKVIAASPIELIQTERTRILDTLVRVFEFEKIENWLGPIAAIVRVDGDIEQFHKVSQISVARMLTLSVHEAPKTRSQALEILEILTKVEEADRIVPGLVKLLGLQQVASLAYFFLDWSKREGFNCFALELLKKFTTVIVEDARLKTEFALKCAPMLSGIVADAANERQRGAVEILSMLLS
jgi:hypothetical protein